MALPSNILGSVLSYGHEGKAFRFDHRFDAVLPFNSTFTRSGTRTYLVNGVLSYASTGVPCFESWDGATRGISMEPQEQNVLFHSNLMTGPSNSINDIRYCSMAQTGELAPDGAATAWTVAETVAGVPSLHGIAITSVGVQIVSGDRVGVSAFVKRPAGSIRRVARLQLNSQYGTNGAAVYFNLDSTGGFYTAIGYPEWTDVDGHCNNLGNGWYRLTVTGQFTGVSTGMGCELVFVKPESSTGDSGGEVAYLGDATNTTLDFFGITLSKATGTGPLSYIPTTTSAITKSADSLTLNGANWFNPVQGTLYMEHDCEEPSGALIGCGANTILASSGTPGESAISWDASSNADTVHNGGAAINAAKPTIGSSILTMLGNSSQQLNGHIRRLTYYPTRLTVAELQSITTQTVVSTANPIQWRGASTNNYLPSTFFTADSNSTGFASRFRYTIPNHDYSALKLDFCNFYQPGTLVPNNVYIDKVAFERADGVVEYVPVTFGGQRNTTLSPGQSHLLSDVILPSSFTSLSAFTANTHYWVRVEGHIASGDKYPCSRNSGYAGAGAISFTGVYGTHTYSTDGTGALTSNVGTNQPVTAFQPIVIGAPIAGDPISLFVVGDSIGSGEQSFIDQPVYVLGIPCLRYVQGGSTQGAIGAAFDVWSSYLQYGRVLLDQMGANDANKLSWFSYYWAKARKLYNYDKIYKVGLTPLSSSTDGWATLAHQTTSGTYPGSIEKMAIDLATAGPNKQIDGTWTPMSVRDTTNTMKWIANGTAGYMTTDGLHPTLAANTLMGAEFQSFLAAITVS